MAHTGLALHLFMGGDDEIIVKESWRPQPGDPMPQMPGCFIGKKFGAGALSFNQIYDIVDEDGNSTDQAIKVCKPTLAARRSLAHEWKMFKDLSLLAEEFQAARSHFLQAHRVVRLGDGHIAAIVMEKANGKNVDKTLRDHKFCNVRYVIALLRDLLVGLDVAQRVLGFTHYDLKLDNVMEHWTDVDPKAGGARVMIDAVPQFKCFDFGTAVIYPDPFSMHHPVMQDAASRAGGVSGVGGVSGDVGGGVGGVSGGGQQHNQHPDAAPQLAEQRPHNRRGRINEGVMDHTSGFEYSTPFCCVRIYHIWWKQRGDVFRVLSALCKRLDDRTWPLEDLELVSLLFTVLEHATNSRRRLKAKFEPRSVLLHRLYGPHPPPPIPSSAGGVGDGGVGGEGGGGSAAVVGSVGGLSRALSQALIQQHSQLVLQGSSAQRTAASASLRQGGSSSVLPSAASIEAHGRKNTNSSTSTSNTVNNSYSSSSSGNYHQQQQQMKRKGQGQQQQHQYLQGVAESEGEAEEAVLLLNTPPLRINTTKLPPVSTPTSAGGGGGAAAAGGGVAHSGATAPLGSAAAAAAAGGGGDDIKAPPSPSPTATPTATPQYTPRRSTEVSRSELSSSSTVPGLSYVRLQKVSPTPPPAAASLAAAGTAGGSPAGVGFAGSTAAAAAAGAAPPSPFAGSHVQGGGGGGGAGGGPHWHQQHQHQHQQQQQQQGFGGIVGGTTGSNSSSSSYNNVSNNNSSSSRRVSSEYRRGGGGATANGGSSSSSPDRQTAGGAGAVLLPGVQPMVSAAPDERRQRQQHRLAAHILQHQQQQQQQQVKMVDEEQQEGGSNDMRAAVAAATAAAAAAAATPPHTQPLKYIPPAAAAPAGVQQQDAAMHTAPPAVGGGGVLLSASNTATANTSNNTNSTSQPPPSPLPQRYDSANTIVAKQPVAPAAQQSVLGSRKALRGVTAQQLLVEPIVQSLLSKV